MAAKTAQDIFNLIYKEIASLLFPVKADGSPPPGFACIMLPGITVNKEDWDITTPNGVRNTYDLPNDLPHWNKVYSKTTSKVSDVYRLMLDANVPPDDPKELAKRQKQYDDAMKLLYTQDEDGEDVPTKMYAAYKSALSKYNLAIAAYNKAEQDEDVVATSLAAAQVEIAQNELKTQGKQAKVEKALDDIVNFEQYGPAQALATARRKFENAGKKFQFIDGVHYPAYLTPSQWMDPTMVSWTSITVNESSSSRRSDERVDSIEASMSGRAGWWLWSARGSAEASKFEQRLNKDSQVEKLGIKFDLARVEINRPWFQTGLYLYDNLSLNNSQKRGDISNGDFKHPEKCKMPALPGAFILAKDVTIYSEFSTDVENLINSNEMAKAGISVGWGPFGLSGSTKISHKLTKAEEKHYSGCAKISIGSGVQIIGLINNFIPNIYPPK